MNEEIRRILKMVEDGKISAEEGVRLIEALEQGRKRSRGIFTILDGLDDLGRGFKGLGTGLGRKEFRFPGAKELDLKGVSGDITIKGDRADLITITGDGLMIARESDNRVRIKAMSGDITAVVPEKTNLNLVSASGDVEISDLSGNLTLKVAAGDITIKNFSGRIDISGAFGDLDLDLSHLEEGHIKAAFGDIEVGLNPDEDVEVEVRLKKKGKIANEAGLKEIEKKPGYFLGRSGKGEHRLKIEGERGEVILKRR
ncbi:MAG TPA: hypothetical protein EYP24_04940 [bacterium (Candidatus Stahlbacteria)]|nr:hypothetical protein [Candidatus Stahlbacteria bacterium]